MRLPAHRTALIASGCVRDTGIMSWKSVPKTLLFLYGWTWVLLFNPCERNSQLSAVRVLSLLLWLWSLVVLAGGLSPILSLPPYRSTVLVALLSTSAFRPLTPRCRERRGRVLFPLVLLIACTMTESAGAALFRSEGNPSPSARLLSFCCTPPPSPLVGFSIWMERGRQQNDRTLADG